MYGVTTDGRPADWVVAEPGHLNACSGLRRGNKCNERWKHCYIVVLLIYHCIILFYFILNNIDTMQFTTKHHGYINSVNNE